MIVIRLNDVAPLLNATLPLTRVAKRADIKCSPRMMSLIVSHHSSQFIAVLQMMPRFFTAFAADRSHHSRIFLDFFYQTMFNMERNNFSSFSFFFRDDQRVATLQFQNSGTGQVVHSGLVLMPPVEADGSPIDWRVFVGIDSTEFRHITTELSIYYNDSIRVTLTSSQVKFSVATEEIVLTAEQNQCIIGGVAGGEQAQFLISLNPMSFFIEVSNWSNKVWLSKTTDSCSIMAIPWGLFAGILIYFPQR